MIRGTGEVHILKDVREASDGCFVTFVVLLRRKANVDDRLEDLTKSGWVDLDGNSLFRGSRSRRSHE